MRFTATAALVIAMLAGGCGGDGPTAPSGTDLSGTWQSDVRKYQSVGQTASVVLRFVVDSSSTTLTSIELCDGSGNPCTAIVDASWMPAVPVSGGRFEFKQDYPNRTCNGVSARLEFTGSFRSATRADGTWEDRNYGPPNYSFCGTQAFDWTATKR